MTYRRIGIIMNGVTGRMGTNQHLLRSLVAIRDQGGIVNEKGECIIPDPILVGRDEGKLKGLAELSGFKKYTTNLDLVIDDSDYPVYFDAQATDRRVESVKQALLRDKHIYCEKPVATDLSSATELYHLATDRGIKHGVVQDKLWLPGIQKLLKLKEKGFFGRIISVKGDFGYWVFEGHTTKPQRPSWNYRKEDGGGIILDMFCHWRYLLDNCFGNVISVSCRGTTLIPERMDESGSAYRCTADDSAYAIFELEGGILAQFNSSWATRVRRDDLLVVQVDGTRGSAVAGLRDVYVQDYDSTPIPVWNPDIPKEIDFNSYWSPALENERFENAFKIQWELFLRHVLWDEPFKWNLLEGAKGVQLAEAGLQSWKERRWVDLKELT